MNISRFCSVLCRQTIIRSQIYDPHGLFTRKTIIRPLILRHSSDNRRQVSTIEAESKTKRSPSLIYKLLKKIPFLNVERHRIAGSAYFLYESIADGLDYMSFMEKYELPDTFYSWFVLTELHIWMLSARAMAEDEDGHILRNSLVEALWTDVAKRTQKLGQVNPAAMRVQIKDLSEQLQAAFIAYDEGLQSDDIVLAGAIWRRMYQMQYTSPHHIEDIVRYIRKHMTLLDNLSLDQITSVTPVKWEMAIRV
ncbi:hypothetical protein ABEB36_012474 [Hypothenemus hampei]|uniref:Ubiquinol-cytochrome c chaperone domain-containing protein n=1 Tax=Hypothenemus hampei TaxID=57062 RepID=A0ABD1EBL7_HYPHA